MFKKNNYTIYDGIKVFDCKDKITDKVITFYKDDPFPNYELFDNKLTILKKGDQNLFTANLKKFIGYNKKVLEVGAGTCQLSNYLSIGNNNQITAFDANLSSLRAGLNFAKKNEIRNVDFVCGDIFDNHFSENYFDIILCNGVLHHTKDTFGAMTQVIKSLKKNGILLVGLYNKYGRLRTFFRKYLYKIFGKKYLMIFDPVLRKTDSESIKKIDAWIKDQYTHPVERSHTFDEVIENFRINNIEFYNSFPSCDFFKNSDEQQDVSNLFEKGKKGSKIERLLAQICMVFNRQGDEGGLYIFLGQKKD
jgi:ubiquinone/menaquinone biosynthesis C-methylase UbiE